MINNKNSVSDWQEEVGVYLITSKFQQFKAKHGFNFRAKFYSKKQLKQASKDSDEVFEQSWEELARTGAIKPVTVLVKYDEHGKIVKFLDPKEPRNTMSN